MDSKSEFEFGPLRGPERLRSQDPNVRPKHPQVRPGIVLPKGQQSPSDHELETSHPVTRGKAGDQVHSDSPRLVARAEQEVKSRSTSSPDSSGLGGLYFLLASAALMFGIWFIGPRLVEEYHYAAALGRTRGEFENAVSQLEKQPLSNVSQAYQLVAQRIRPSVVSINAIKTGRDGSGLGSGVIMSEDGYIMTNAHVLEGAKRFYVELHDRRRYPAELIGTDSISDLALLKIDAPNLIPATWGESDNVNVGSIVWAIGSPYGFQQTVTSGILSGKDRPGDPDHQKQSLLQTDAAVNPGNSGGPLVDSQGHVIGINTSIFGETFQGISFAVPSATARFVYDQLLKNGNVTRGYLGVYPAEVEYRDAVRMQLPDLDGAKLSRVVPGSPAYHAGIRRNDIIRSWNGMEVKEFKNLFRFAEMTKPRTRVKVSLLRNGEERVTEVTVGTLPPPNSVPLPSQFYRN